MFIKTSPIDGSIMAGKSDPVPEWANGIYDHLVGKPHKYRDLIENSFAIIAHEESQTEGYAFGMGFLFKERLCPEQMKSDLRKYRIVAEVAQAESLDLIGIEPLNQAVRYREDLPLKTLAVGYLGKRPSLEEIDKVFSAYDHIEARLEE